MNKKIVQNFTKRIPLRNTIAFRSLVSFALAFFIVLAFSGSYLVSQQLRSIRDESHESNQVILHQAILVLNNLYDLFLNRLTLLATIPYISNQGATESGKYLKSYSVAPLFIPGEHVTLYNSRREKVSDNSMVGIAPVSIAYHELKNFDDIESQRPYISPLYWEQNTPKKIVAVLVENRATSDGYLTASFSFRRVWDVFENFKVGTNGLVIVIDESGSIVYHPNLREWVFTHKNASDFGIEGFDVLNFKPSPQRYYKICDGKEYLINYEYDPRIKLGVITLLPREEVESQAHAFSLSFILVAIAFLIALIFVGVWLFYKIEQPIQQLIQKMIAIAHGNYEKNSRISTSDSNDEINALSQVFETMRRTIREKAEALARHQAMLEDEIAKRTEKLEQANAKLNQISRTDELTKLPNRRDIREKIGYEISRYERSRRNFSFLFVDIDKFKDFNDHYGHVCGDLVLKTVANVMRDSLRKQDVVARWGGEEFLALLPETPLVGAGLVANRLCEKISKTVITIANQTLQITITVGVAEYDERLGMDHSIDLADRALYSGKMSGRNKVVIFNPEDITEEDLAAAKTEMEFAKKTGKVISTDDPKALEAPQDATTENS